jgi:hypothetical protein
VSDEAQETRPNEGGRPSGYSQELADRICAELADGKSLRTVCKAEGMPSTQTVFRWLRTHEGFCDQYARAKDEAADALVDEMLDIADEATNDWMEVHDKDNPGYRLNGEHINRSRLRVDTRKWIAAKLKPKRYGDKVAVGGAEDLPPIQTADMTDVEVARTLAFLLAKGAQAQEKAH